MYSLSHKISAQTTEPPIAWATSTRLDCRPGFAAITGEGTLNSLGKWVEITGSPNWQQFITNVTHNQRTLTVISKDIIMNPCWDESHTFVSWVSFLSASIDARLCWRTLSSFYEGLHRSSVPPITWQNTPNWFLWQHGKPNLEQRTHHNL